MLQNLWHYYFEKDFQKHVKRILIYSISTIIIGVFTLTIFENWISQLYFLILFIVTVIWVFIYSYRLNRVFTLNTYVDKYFKKLVTFFEKDNISEEEVNKILNEFRLFFDECATKEEYYVCSNISKKSVEIFEVLLEKCNRMIINKKEKIAEYIFGKIINIGLYEIEIAENCKSTNLLYEIFMQQNKNLELCIKIGRFEWFKEYITKINSYMGNVHRKSNTLLFLWEINENIGELLLDGKQDWLEWLLNELYGINISFKYMHKEMSLKYYNHFLIYILLKELESAERKNYEMLITNLKRFTSEVFHQNENLSEFVVNYSVLAKNMYDKEMKKELKDFFEIVTSQNNILDNDQKWNEFLLYFLNITMEKWEGDFGKNNREIITNKIIKLSQCDNGINYYGYFPKYDMLINKNKMDSPIIDCIYEEFKTIFSRLIINNDLKLFYHVLKVHQKAITTLERNDRNVQEKLFEIYIFILNKVMNIENKKFIELVLGIMDETIEILDSNKKISNQFGNYIIEKISSTVMHKSYAKEDNMEQIIYFLSMSMDKQDGYKFILTDNSKINLLYKTIYNIGICCIENNMERALRDVSNCLGWKIIASIDNGNASQIDYLIERTIDLYNIAKNMQISKKTIVFMTTLFTTVGTYCCKEVKNRKYLKKIKEIILKETDVDSVKTAIELRTKENNIWDELFDGKTQELTAEFLKEINKPKR